MMAVDRSQMVSVRPQEDSSPPEGPQDLFISHASEDKERYVEPLAQALTDREVRYWLSCERIGWGGRVVGRINEGLKNARWVLLCLSRHFLGKSWPQAEMEAALARQNDSGQDSVLPLILNSEQRILEEYPLLRGRLFRRFDSGIDSIVGELADLTSSSPSRPSGKEGVRVRVESVHSGRLCDVVVSPRASIDWLVERCRLALGGSDKADIGALKLLSVVWTLVDVGAEEHWKGLSDEDRVRLRAVVRAGDNVNTAEDGETRIEELAVPDGTVFHLYGSTRGHIILQADPLEDPSGPFFA